MITRRNLFKGFAASIGALVLKPFVKAEPKKYSSYLIDPKYIIESVPSNGWIHGHSIDDVHFETSELIKKTYGDKILEDPLYRHS
jgi:hypothetical protein